MEELENKDEFSDNENYNLLINKIQKISDIKEIKANYRYYDYKEPEYDIEQNEIISFKKFIGDY